MVKSQSSHVHACHKGLARVFLNNRRIAHSPCNAHSDKDKPCHDTQPQSREKRKLRELLSESDSERVHESGCKSESAAHGNDRHTDNGVIAHSNGKTDKDRNKSESLFKHSEECGAGGKEIDKDGKHKSFLAFGSAKKSAYCRIQCSADDNQIEAGV